MKTWEGRVTLFGRLMHSNPPNIISLLWILGTVGEKTRAATATYYSGININVKGNDPCHEVALFWCTTLIVLCFSSGNSKS